MREQELRAWLRAAHSIAADMTVTRDDRAEAGLVEDDLAEQLRLVEPTRPDPRGGQEWR